MFTEVYKGYTLFFLFLLKNVDCWYSLEPPRRDGLTSTHNLCFEQAEAVLTSTHNLCFEQKYEKYQNFYLKTFSFLVVKFSIYLNRRVFIMRMFFVMEISKRT